MKNLVIKKQIEVNLTPEQWQLFTVSMDCRMAAACLNAAFELHFNYGKPKNEVRNVMNKVMDEFASFGAADTEPGWVLEDLLDACYRD